MAYFNQTAAGGHCVLGRRLSVLSIRHLEVLEQTGNPVLDHADMAALRLGDVDFLNLVAMLGQEPDRFLADVRRKRPWRRIHWVQLRLFLGSRVANLMARRRLAAWMDDNWNPPDIVWSEGKTARAPYTDHLRVILCQEGLASGVEAAGKFAVSQALHLAEAVEERRSGESRLRGRGDASVARFWREQEQRLAAADDDAGGKESG